MPSRLKGSIATSAAILAIAAAAAWLDVRFGAVATAFDFIAHQFYEIPMLASIRRPSQIALVRVHLTIFASLACCAAAVTPFLSRNGKLLVQIFLIGYAFRAVVWIVGGNLPLVPGDDCHYLEVAKSVYRGEGPVKHYVESYFIDYPEIRLNKGILDDWATPLYAYVLAGAYRLTGVVPGESIEATVAVSKGTSFVFGLLTLPLLFGFALRRYGSEAALAATAMLAVIPVHVLYAGLGLRESLVAFMCLAAVWLLTEIDATDGISSWLCAIAGGIAAGCAILARDASIALVAALGVYAIVRFGKSKPLGLFAWGLSAAVVIAPWAWATTIRYGKPFYTYTQYFQYTFSWTIHHYQEGIPRAADFYTWANAPSILRVKIKSIFIILTVSTMILGPPLVYGIARRFWSRRRNQEKSGGGCGSTRRRNRSARRLAFFRLRRRDPRSGVRYHPGHTARSLLSADLRRRDPDRRGGFNRFCTCLCDSAPRLEAIGAFDTRVMVGRSYVVIRLHVVHQAVSIALACAPRRGGLDENAPRGGSPRRPRDDVVSLGTEARERSADDPHAAFVLPERRDAVRAARPRDPTIRSHSRALGFIRNAPSRRPRNLRSLPRPRPCNDARRRQRIDEV